ncbi:carbonic anhydrase [Sphingobacterium sp. UT-1RO-CII-1]|uniref:carbonic anhydrase n=1 Tax=Sphingobacterium sp. UT-1RO-CII-1 TaxID=2995225 RepID=UPI00227AB6EB|nr:carbonic anhydrase [Sphingobacterium sp. UT-1RO-CII-1]MCY4781178.1 carbonic anhydrase [Sphingobacterium sp. UT-1RO-CII-1]
MKIDSIFENNKAWIKQKLAIDQNYFVNLAAGQEPEVLYIGCSDSRVTAEELMGLSTGEVFVHRNIANVVPNTDLNSKSVIEYAVSHLKVKHIVVCGHYNCGGIQAAMEHEYLGILNPWLNNIRDVYRLHRDRLEAIEDLGKRCDKLVELNVAEQCLNVAKIPEVQQAILNHQLALHGWVFDVRTGELIDLTQDFLKVVKENQLKTIKIYHVK